MYIEVIKEKVRIGRYRLSEHADHERENDGITIQELKRVILKAEFLEDYPEDKRGQSCLLLGYDSKERPIHVVCAIDMNDI
ncbi:MAG: DUF4258 domain-containing protein, partial [Ignavibacteriales bacterium]|nr:DUF4258 domain-containing protein [Ignavibacteriales bacterium]